MKTASTALQTFLASNSQFAMADLYTITLSGGTVLRYSSAGQVVNANGFAFLTGPRFVRKGVKQQRGVQVDTLNIDVYADSRHTINGVPLLTFIKNKGFDSALIKIERAFAQDWSTAAVGTVILFSGRLQEIQSAGVTAVTLVVANGLGVLAANMPVDVYQASCLNTLFDANCGLNRSPWAATGSVSAGSISASAFPSSLTDATKSYALGTVVFTGGANNGVRRTIKSKDASGNLQFTAPFPSAPAAGDAFTAYPGCDLSQGTCSGTFNNLPRFRGQPYIPVPETILGGVGASSVGSTPTAGGAGPAGGATSGPRMASV